MRFSTLCLLVAVSVIAVSLESYSEAGDVRKSEVKEQAPERVIAPLFSRTRTRAVNVEVSRDAPVADACGPAGCNRVREVISESRQRAGGLLARVFNRNSRRTVSVSRGCCR